MELDPARVAWAGVWSEEDDAQAAELEQRAKVLRERARARRKRWGIATSETMTDKTD